MKKRNIVFRLLGVLLAASMVLTGCENPVGGPPNGDPGGNPGGGSVTVTDLNLSNKVTAPVKGMAPVTTFSDTTQYTGTITWKDASDNNVSGNFAVNTAYKAVVTLSAKSGYTFIGVAANSFTYNNAAVTNAANSGTVTITFPATAAEDASTIVNNDLDLTGKVTAPVKGAAPVTTFSDTTQYTGTIAWQTEGGGAVGETFGFETVYKAVLTLTAKDGYTFTGLGADSFTYTGATSVTNAAGSGTVTIVFPATEAQAALSGTVTITGTVCVGGTLTADTSDLNGTGTASYVWKRNGSDVTVSETYTPTLDDLGSYITVTVTYTGNSGSITSAPVGPVPQSITFTGINEYYHNQYATFHSGDRDSDALGGEGMYLIGSTNSAEIIGVQISDDGSVTIPVYLVNANAVTSAPYTGNAQNIKIYVIIKDSPSFTPDDIVGNDGAYTIDDVSFKEGSPSVNVSLYAKNVLVITGITDVLLGQALTGISIGIFPAETPPAQAFEKTNIVAGARNDGEDDEDITLYGISAPYTATAELYAFEDGNFSYRWMGSGTYDVYLMLGPENSPTAIYRKQGVSFTSGGVTSVAAIIGEGGFSPVEIPPPQ
jgi:hypothetical protein